MSLKSILLALGIGAASLTLGGCVSEGYYGDGYDPYYSRGSYIGTGVIYDSGGYYRDHRRSSRYYRDSRYRYRDRERSRVRDRNRDRDRDRPSYNKPDRPRPQRPERPPSGNRPGRGDLPIIEPIKREPHN
ncbi:hypothetical protein FHS76_001371 [Ochrobactrum daejeonense]|uniref:Lipoprotein n=1 Tax=Brucella daejeonensis TaxID=659015 RepID=A0A7W9ELY7_9HYPH|nr:hypothetical protein [Brucella daejeonensis]MBB5701520.1 hypothetical protein [Brucella daejeonensis]NKB78882.1 hypothetical protein [Brucella daejeonensis]